MGQDRTCLEWPDIAEAVEKIKCRNGVIGRHLMGLVAAGGCSLVTARVRNAIYRCWKMELEDVYEDIQKTAQLMSRIFRTGGWNMLKPSNASNYSSNTCKYRLNYLEWFWVIYQLRPSSPKEINLRYDETWAYTKREDGTWGTSAAQRSNGFHPKWSAAHGGSMDVNGVLPTGIHPLGWGS